MGSAEPPKTIWLSQSDREDHAVEISASLMNSLHVELTTCDKPGPLQQKNLPKVSETMYEFMADKAANPGVRGMSPPVASEAEESSTTISDDWKNLRADCTIYPHLFDALDNDTADMIMDHVFKSLWDHGDEMGWDPVVTKAIIARLKA
jgi:hypothetical protein